MPGGLQIKYECIITYAGQWMLEIGLDSISVHGMGRLEYANIRLFYQQVKDKLKARLMGFRSQFFDGAPYAAGVPTLYNPHGFIPIRIDYRIKRIIFPGKYNIGNLLAIIRVTQIMGK